MGDKTGISWTDASWNPVTGCHKVSPGCKNCYAEGVAERFWKTQYPRVPVEPWVPNIKRPRVFTDVQCHEGRLDWPLKWKKPRRIFVNSMSDLFHEAVPDEFIDRVFAVMALCPQHTFQILTKRPERMRRYCSNNDTMERVMKAVAFVLEGSGSRVNVNFVDDGFSGVRLNNVHLGVSCENQETADERIPLLLQTPAAVRFVSAEPLLSELELFDTSEGVLRGVAVIRDGCVNRAPGEPDDPIDTSFPGLDWVIVGGESGHGARPCDVGWIRSIVEQCKAAEVACFTKQLGSNAWDEHVLKPGSEPHRAKVSTRSLKGDDPSEWPEDLRVQEFPVAP